MNYRRNWGSGSDWRRIDRLERRDDPPDFAPECDSDEEEDEEEVTDEELERRMEAGWRRLIELAGEWDKRHGRVRQADE